VNAEWLVLLLIVIALKAHSTLDVHDTCLKRLTQLLQVEPFYLVFAKFTILYLYLYYLIAPICTISFVRRELIVDVSILLRYP